MSSLRSVWKQHITWRHFSHRCSLSVVLLLIFLQHLPPLCSIYANVMLQLFGAEVVWAKWQHQHRLKAQNTVCIEGVIQYRVNAVSLMVQLQRAGTHLSFKWMLRCCYYLLVAQLQKTTCKIERLYKCSWLQHLWNHSRGLTNRLSEALDDVRPLSCCFSQAGHWLLFLLNIRFWSILVLSSKILHWELTSTSGWDICVFTGRSSGLQGPSGNCSNGQLTTVKTLRYRLIQSCAQWVQRLDFSQRRVTERRLELWFVDNGNASFSLSTVTGHQTINHKITNAWMLLHFSALILFFAFTQWGNINPTVSRLSSSLLSTFYWICHLW